MVQQGQLEQAQKSLGSKQFSQNVTMEAYNRALGQAQFELLKSLANPDVIQVEAPKAKKAKAKAEAKEETEPVTEEAVEKKAKPKATKAKKETKEEPQE